MKVYDRQGTPNAARIRIVLAEKGLEDQVEFVPIDLIAAEQKTDDFLRMNPTGKTPLLELADGLILSESTAITEYLDNLDGKPVLTGATPRDKAAIHMMQRRTEIMLLEPIDDYFHYGTPGLGSALRPWRMPDWPGAKEWGERRGALAVTNAPYFDALLSHSPFLNGDRYSMADITLYTAVIFADAIGLPVALDQHGLTAWQKRMESVPAVRDRSGQSLLPEDVERIGK